MKKLLISSALLLSFYSIKSCALEKKKTTESSSIVSSKEREIFCSSCKTYAFTYDASRSTKEEYILWDDIIKPKSFTRDDLGTYCMRLYPSMCLPSLRCLTCYTVLATPQKMRSGDITRIAYYFAAKSKRSISS